MPTLVTYTYSLDGLPELNYPIALLPSGSANTPALDGEEGIIAHRNEASARSYCREHYGRYLETLRWIVGDPAEGWAWLHPGSPVAASHWLAA